MQFCIEFLQENIKPSIRRKAVILPFEKHKHFSLVICRLLKSNRIHFLMQSAVIDPNGFLVLFWVRWIATFADFRIISVISQLIVRWRFKSIDYGIPSVHMEKNFASSLRLVCKTERNILRSWRERFGCITRLDQSLSRFFSTATIAHLLSRFVLLAKCLEQVRKEIGGTSKDLNWENAIFWGG